MSEKCKHGIRDTTTNLPYCRLCAAEAKSEFAAANGSEVADDRACQRCGRFYDLREGEEPTPLCDECAQSEWARFKQALERILEYPVHSEPIGGAMAMKDIAHDALNPQNEKLSEPGAKT